MKDNFSSGSAHYAKFRPGYPAAFFDYLRRIVPHQQDAWDCGTGNGQLALELAKIFERVYASDISQAQIDQAGFAPNITYVVQAAEQTHFADQQFDLIIVGQAIHWFDFDRFYAEVRRTARPEALICAVGYGKVCIEPLIDQCITEFYQDVVGPYWDPERRYIDEHYTTIPFPFSEIQAPKFEHSLHWTLDHLIGYLNTWSAVKHFIQQHGDNPVTSLIPKIAPHWLETAEKEVRFPLLMRIGWVHSR